MVKSAITSGVMYDRGSPISYTSCSVTVWIDTQAAGVGMLGDDEGAVFPALDDRIADVTEVGDRAPIVEAIPTRSTGRRTR